ncbi:LysR substrate-binding domain-containing protein [Actinomadura sp. B10D3]|uniref:LysR substrate-binding domain-containing protein n=1 Tax=Actinomadura sp. B10D3 TaxID=3153557 RepID=UPI00325E8623
MEDRLAAFATLDAGQLRLSGFPSANTYLVPEAIRRFSDAHPGVTLSLDQTDQRDPLVPVRDGRVDLALVTAWQPVNDQAAVELIPLLDEELLLALPSHHPLARHTSVHLRDLRDETWIEGAHPDCLGPIPHLADMLGNPPRIGFTCDDWNGKQVLMAKPVEATPMTTTSTDYQMAFFAEHLPAPPARVLDAGCGRGELAAVLQGHGYEVTGIDNDPRAVAVAQGNAAPVIEADITRYRDHPFDAVLFSLSLDHVDRLHSAVARARSLLKPDGLLIVDEFAWERADRATATWFYDIAALISSIGLPGRRGPAEPADQPLRHWTRRHRDSDPMHTGAAMTDAITTEFDLIESARVPYLHRYLGGWLPDDATGRRWSAVLRDIEQRRVADGTLAPVGLRIVARPAGSETPGRRGATGVPTRRPV